MKKVRLLLAAIVATLALSTAACTSPTGPDHTIGSGNHTIGSWEPHHRFRQLGRRTGVRQGLPHIPEALADTDDLRPPGFRRSPGCRRR